MNSHSIAFFLNLAKWPIALLFAGFLPAAALTFYDLALLSPTYIEFFTQFIAGLFTYLLVWLTMLRYSRFTFLSTLEHEITHCIFAWLTLNKVTGLRATLRDGGRMTFTGASNWLISTAPYFFPTVTVLLLVAFVFIDGSWKAVMFGLIGVSIAYHVTSTWAETHHAQTDLKESGFVFCLLFLPTANFMCYTLILSYMESGFKGLGLVLHSLWMHHYNPIVLLAAY
jgi:hypothetical protein